MLLKQSQPEGAPFYLSSYLSRLAATITLERVHGNTALCKKTKSRRRDWKAFDSRGVHWRLPHSPPCLTGYLSKVLRNYTEQACEGDFLSVHCPPRTTITVQSAFYGRRGLSDPLRCPQSHQALLSHQYAREDDRYCSVSTALQVCAHFFTTLQS